MHCNYEIFIQRRFIYRQDHQIESLRSIGKNFRWRARHPMQRVLWKAKPLKWLTERKSGAGKVPRGNKVSFDPGLLIHGPEPAWRVG